MTDKSHDLSLTAQMTLLGILIAPTGLSAKRLREMEEQRAEEEKIREALADHSTEIVFMSYDESINDRRADILIVDESSYLMEPDPVMVYQLKDIPEPVEVEHYDRRRKAWKSPYDRRRR